MTNIEWLIEHDREYLTEMCASTDCDFCPCESTCDTHMDCVQSSPTCVDMRRAWLEAEHDETETNQKTNTKTNLETNLANLNDSRDKLEADIRRRCTLTSTEVTYTSGDMIPHRLDEHYEVSGLRLDDVIEWLDRQAAITRDALRDELASMRDHDDALCDEVRELRDELELRTIERDEANRRLRVICEASAMLGAYRKEVDA